MRFPASPLARDRDNGFNDEAITAVNWPAAENRIVVAGIPF